MQTTVRADVYSLGTILHQMLKGISFDNMQSRPIKGTVDWRKYEIVLDVPQQTAGIYFGVLLAGSGGVWLSNVQLEIVGEGVPTTA